jgi:pilus assembly protein Flp/PilA
MQALQRFLRDEDGPTAVEYAVMLALIVVVCLSGISLIGQYAFNSFMNSADAINSAAGGGS